MAKANKKGAAKKKSKPVRKVEIPLPPHSSKTGLRLMLEVNKNKARLFHMVGYDDYLG